MWWGWLHVQGRLPQAAIQQLLRPAQPLVTVCIPTHNRGPELLSTLRTVAAQTAAVDVVVVDDATSDPDDVLALQVATKFAEEHGWRYACSGPCVVLWFCA